MSTAAVTWGRASRRFAAKNWDGTGRLFELLMNKRGALFTDHGVWHPEACLGLHVYGKQRLKTPPIPRKAGLTMPHGRGEPWLAHAG